MADQSRVIVACMRNEGLFVVEWVAHHLAIGFDHVVVCTNACDDQTDRLLALMQAGGAPVTQIDNPGRDRETIQKTALDCAFALSLVREAALVLHLDADEYVNVTLVQRRVSDLTDRFDYSDGIALLWRHFGNAGLQRWPGGSVVETFTQAEAPVPNPRRGRDVGFKTLFRPGAFARMGGHHPRMPLGPRDPVIVNTTGAPMPLTNVRTKRGLGYPVTGAHCTWDNAALHHHHVKSDDLHRIKHARGDANGADNAKRQIGSPAYLQANRNDVQDLSLVALRARVAPVEAALRALPGMADAQAMTRTWFDRFRVTLHVE